MAHPTAGLSAASGPRVLAVDGLDGSGKSRFAAALGAALEAGGRAVSLLHVDDFRRPLDFAGLEAQQEASLYYDRYFDFAALGAALAAAPAANLVIVEGVMVLRAALPEGAALLVLEVSLAEARRRILARDQAKGRTPAEITHRIDRRYFPAQARYRAAFDPQGRADMVIDNDDWVRPRLVRGDRGGLPPDVAAAVDRLLRPPEGT